MIANKGSNLRQQIAARKLKYLNIGLLILTLPPV